MKVEVGKAKKEDFEDYYELKKLECAENTKLMGELIEVPPKLKEDFLETISGKEEVILFAKNEKVEGYIRFSFFDNFVYIDDIFVKEELRKKGIASKLIEEIFKIAKEKKLEKVRLGVLINNQNAINLYKKLGFDFRRYEMEKELK